MASILVTGIAGGLSQRVAERLLSLGHEVVGADYRPTPPLGGALRAIPTYQANYNKTVIEDVFKRHAFDWVLHLGRVGNLKEGMGKRFDLNVVGSQKIMNLCAQHKVHRLIVLSTFHIYGAHPSNHIPIFEDEPLRSGAGFPQLADAIQLDNMAATWVYQHRDVSVAVLRPTNVIGPGIRNTMSNFLRNRRVPYLAGYNPMMQFLHEDDLAEAIVAAAASRRRGIYNLAGPAVVPWRTALDLAQAVAIPVPSALAVLYVRAFSGLPEYLINFFKYPCVISDRAFRKTFSWEPRVGIRDTLWTTVAAARERQLQAHP